MDDGYRIKLKREGEAGANGGPQGDLYLLIRVSEHEFFERDGNNIHLEQKLSFVQAALGCTLKIPTLTSSVKLSIPAGTQGGQIFRIRGEGVPDVHTGSKGDQLVTVTVHTPQKLPMRSKELLIEFAKSMGEEIPEEKICSIELLTKSKTCLTEDLGQKASDRFGKSIKLNIFVAEFQLI